MKKKWSQWYSLGLAFLSAVLCGFLSIRTHAATPMDFIQQGQAYYNQGHFERAIALWKQAESAYHTDVAGVTGSRLNQAQALIAIGQQRQACKLLTTTLYTNASAERLCDGAPDVSLPPKVLPPSLAIMGTHKLAEALQHIGHLEAAERLLQQQWTQLPMSMQPEWLLALGNVYRELGNRDRDRTEELDATQIKPSNCLTSIDPTTKAAGYYSHAIACYQAAAQTLTKSTTINTVETQANLNHLSLVANIYQWLTQEAPDFASSWLAANKSQINLIRDQVKAPIEPLPGNIEQFYAQLNYAHAIALINGNSASSQDTIERLIKQAIAAAKTWNNQRLESLAIGELGWLYEQTNRLPEALKATEAALSFSRSIEVNRIHPQDLTYQWEWQRGRILRDLGQEQAAIAAYRQAIAALQTVREQVLAVNPDAQFALRDSIEPIYRELIDLLLPVDRPVSQEALKDVIGQIDALQLAELENFLRCRLPDSKANQSAPFVDPSAAIVYSIILPDRLEVILQTAQQPLQRHTVRIERSQLNQLLQQTVRSIRQSGDDSDLEIQDLQDLQKRQSNQVYQWLVKPFDSVLKQHSIQTLVFVSDGAFRDLPMAALYDQQTSSYLIDQYAIAVSPGTQLLGVKPQTSPPRSALIAGLTTDQRINIVVRGINRPFDQLPNVINEVTAIKTLLPQSTTLMGQDFTPENFRTQFNDQYYPIVHLASHGYFSSDPRQTFIVTDAGQYILVDDLQRLVRDRQEARPKSIELIVLSACQTAKGDRRSTLGFAGAAIRAGANSTLASLWSVNDASTAAMMEAFYQALTQSQPTITKADALRQAQLKIRQIHKLAYNWAPFTLVGNWR